MKVILVYDIDLTTPDGHRRLNRARKISRKYLNHIQKSVYEGELTFGQLKSLESEITKIVDLNKDSIILYTFPDTIQFERKVLTNVAKDIDNII